MKHAEKLVWKRKQNAMKMMFVFLLYLLLGFPLFYFVYKFGNPEPLAHDYFQYYWLYKDFDVSRVIAPHNMRLLGAFFVYVFYKLNFYYETASAYDAYVNWGFLKQVYFNAIFFNYCCVTACSTLLFTMVQRQFGNTLLSLLAGTLFLLGFGTMFYLLMPLTDAFSVLLFLLAYKMYLNRSAWVGIVLFLSVFQREYVLMAFAVMAALDYLKLRGTYYLWTSICALLCFAVYLVLRKTLFYTPHLDYQSSLDYFKTTLFSLNYPLWSFLKQLMMTLNLYFIYLAVLLYKKSKRLTINQHQLLMTLVLFFMTVFVSHVAGHGNNCGRYFYMVSPMIVWVAVGELADVLAPLENRTMRKVD
jgi:hypothetical protein